MTRAGYKKHRALIEAWAEGKEVQIKSFDDEWRTMHTDISWYEDREYRLKPKVPMIVKVSCDGSSFPYIPGKPDGMKVGVHDFVVLTPEVRAAVEQLIKPPTGGGEG